LRISWENENEFAKRLRQLRTSKNLSQVELAKLVNLHNTHIARYERGTCRPAADTLKRLAEALGVSGDYLLGDDNPQALKANLEDRELLTKFQEAEKLPAEDKLVVIKLLDAFLAKKQIQAIVSR
jgi:transcriptional regulator with XRE-family HTH domain